MVDISTVRKRGDGAPKNVRRLKTPHRELSRKRMYVSFGIGTLLGCRAIELGKLPEGVCDIVTP